MRAKPDFESVAHVTGKDVQMDVKYFLPRRSAIRKADIYPFTLNPAITQCHGNTLRDAKHMRAFFLVQIHKARGMSVGNYERMSGIDRLNVHESRAAIILVNHTDFQFA
jgi:hypothetical protein